MVLDMNNLKWVVLFLISFPVCCFAKKERKNSLYGGVALKHSFCYNRSHLVNTDNIYYIHTKLQPVLQILDVYKVNNSWSVVSGLSISSSAYHIDYTYTTSKFQFYQTFAIKTTTLKLPINIQTNLTKQMYATAGVALNLLLHDSYSFESSATGDDSIAIEYSFDAPFKDYVTISVQAGLAYRIRKKFFLTAQFDVDMGKYPAAYVSHHVINLATNKQTTMEFNGRPRFYSVSLGINYKLW